MNTIKISIVGAEGYIFQIPRIREGMKALGHILTDESPDIIYSNDPSSYEEALLIKKKYPKGYLILNFLDVPWHMPRINEVTQALVKEYFVHADSVTTISFKVKKDLNKFYNKKIDVIYNPIKDVYFDEKIKKDNMFLYVGRANDPIKRFSLAHESINKLYKSLETIKICGPEDPGCGKYLGVIPDDELNKIYNSSKYVLLTSRAEGLGLPMIEGMICGAIPITCSDNLTAKEFSPTNFICEPKVDSIMNKIIMLDKNYEKNRKIALDLGKKYKIKFDKKTVAKNIIKLFNSR